MGRVGLAGLYTWEALSASSQSCDAVVCVTWVSLRQFWSALCLTGGISLLAALISVLQKTNIISLLLAFPCCISFQLFGGCANLNALPNPFSSGEVQSSMWHVQETAVKVLPKDPKGPARGYLIPTLFPSALCIPVERMCFPAALTGGLTVNDLPNKAWLFNYSCRGV